MIYIDGLFLTQRVNGINRYSREVLKELDNRELSFDIAVLVPEKSNVDIKLDKLIIIELTHLNIVRSNNGDINYKGWTRKTAEPYAYLKKGFFINFSGYTPRKACGPSVMFDLRPLCFDDEVRSFSNLKFKFIFWLNCMIAKRRKLEIVTISEYSVQCIIKKLKIDKKFIHNSYCGWDHINSYGYDDSIFEKNPKLKFGEYFFALGSVAPHKNYRWILEAASNNPESVFVIAGGKETNVFGESINLNNIFNIIYLGCVSDEEAKSLMKHARAFLFPSFFEGFGIPPLEAMSLGIKVISSKETCLPEILGNSAYFIDAYNANVDLNSLIEDAIDCIIVENTLNKYSWKKTTDTWVELMKKMEGII